MILNDQRMKLHSFDLNLLKSDGFQIILLFLCSRELQWKRTLNEFHMGLKKKKQNNKSKPWNNS